MLKPKVLIVDDHPENLMAMKAVLESENFEVVESSSGAEALKQMLDHEFAVILLDVQMPVMDGYETATLIRSREKSRTTPIIFISAVFIDEEHTLRGYQVGGVDYIVKPFTPDALKCKVEFFVSYSQTLQSRQRHQDVEEIYDKFKQLFDRIVDPLWVVLLDVQLLKRLSKRDRQKFLTILEKCLDKMEVSTHELSNLLKGYMDELEQNVTNRDLPSGVQV
jgi:DNA-binding response OmpR family regulator